MTAYIHFHIRAGQILVPVRLFNVSSVEDNGLESVRIKMLFSNNIHVYTGVSHVAIQTEKE